ncbi:hypothetical protein F4823DRAFT_545628 [Ustulina deusta]|nr:hypothetical protein F4823DRAFT_545628 [Ustulina deusta]
MTPWRLSACCCSVCTVCTHSVATLWRDAFSRCTCDISSLLCHLDTSLYLRSYTPCTYRRHCNNKQSTCFRASWLPHCALPAGVSCSCCMHERMTADPYLQRPQDRPDPGAEILPPAVACHQQHHRSNLCIGWRRLCRRCVNPIWLPHASLFAASRPSAGLHVVESALGKRPEGRIPTRLTYRSGFPHISTPRAHAPRQNPGLWQTASTVPCFPC